jgi:hypothetical protein
MSVTCLDVVRHFFLSFHHHLPSPFSTSPTAAAHEAYGTPPSHAHTLSLAMLCQSPSHPSQSSPPADPVPHGVDSLIHFLSWCFPSFLPLRVLALPFPPSCLAVGHITHQSRLDPRIQEQPWFLQVSGQQVRK